MGFLELCFYASPFNPNSIHSVDFDPMNFRNNTFVIYRWLMLGCANAWCVAIALIPLGYVTRFHGLGPEWLNDALGSVMYEMFWTTLFLGIWPKVPPLQIAIAVGVATCFLEFLQLWHPLLLQTLRATLPGRLIFGTTFSWLDFPAYLGGSILGFLWGRWLRTKRSLLPRCQKPIA
jgi:hypothetical protein